MTDEKGSHLAKIPLPRDFTVEEIEHILSALPHDAKLVTAHYQFPRDISFMSFEHSSFPFVPAGVEIPDLAGSQEIVDKIHNQRVAVLKCEPLDDDKDDEVGLSV